MNSLPSSIQKYFSFVHGYVPLGIVDEVGQLCSATLYSNLEEELVHLRVMQPTHKIKEKIYK